MILQVYREGGRESMCKIMEEYAEEYAREAMIDATIETALTLGATKERIMTLLSKKFNLDSASALERIEEFTNNPE
jgi:hypothetical protein